MITDQIQIAPVAKVVRIRRLVADELQPRDTPALLINRDDRLAHTHVAQGVAEFSELRGRLDVSPEEDERAGLNAAECGGGLRVEHGTRHAGHEKLAESGHGCGDGSAVPPHAESRMIWNLTNRTNCNGLRLHELINFGLASIVCGTPQIFTAMKGAAG